MRVVFREDQQQREHEVLSEEPPSPTAPGAVPQRADALRTDFQRDRDRFCTRNRFGGFPQDPGVPRFRGRPLPRAHPYAGSGADRRTITRALGLNEDLTEAISLGHDWGTRPPGRRRWPRALRATRVAPARRAAASTATTAVGARGGAHRERRRGLNLTAEVRDGILFHRATCRPKPRAAS
ncbi:MAG: hypothetical protein ACLUW6_06770 [Coriobacteriaceae bacterium]